MQDAAIALTGGTIGGWKVGRINPPVDGIDRLSGPIFADRIFDASIPPRVMTVFAGGFAAAEAEFLLRIGTAPDPAKNAYTLAEATALIDRVCVGIEIASSPFVGINDHGATVTISDFGNNNGLVIGPDITGWRDMDVNAWPVEPRIDGALAGAATTATMLLFDRLGVAGADPGACFSRLWQDAAHRYAGTNAALADMNTWATRFGTALPGLIGAVPRWCLDVAALAPTPADVVARHYGYRTLPTPGAPGGYVPDLQRLEDRPRWTMPSVVAHELLPGHMVQLPLEAAATPHPLRLDYAQGVAEGWSIYAERRVARSGAYATDPLAELGYLHWRIFRIGRALIDLGIHEGLPVATAKARLIAWQGEPAYFAPFDQDLARIVAEPMTRAAEMLASLAIEDGARGRSPASLRRYHALVLDHGRMRSDEPARRARALR